MVQKIHEFGNFWLRCDVIQAEINKAEKNLADLQNENEDRAKSILLFFNKQVLLKRMKAESITYHFEKFNITAITKDNEFVDLDIEKKESETISNCEDAEMMFI